MVSNIGNNLHCRLRKYFIAEDLLMEGHFSSTSVEQTALKNLQCRLLAMLEAIQTGFNVIKLFWNMFYYFA